MVEIPLSVFTCSCGKPLEPSKDKSGLASNEVRCAYCGEIHTIFACGGGNWPQRRVIQDGSQRWSGY